MFPGGGSQYNGMAAGLDDASSVFHETMADGIARVAATVGHRPRAAAGAATPTSTHSARPPASLPAIFLTSVALARQWMAWGVDADAFVGHSLGEYAAAHLAGVLTLDGALDSSSPAPR